MPLSFPEERTGPALFQAYLMKRGITQETAIACGLEVIGRTEACTRLGRKSAVAYPHFIWIPYDETYGAARGLGDLTGTFGAEIKKPTKLYVPKGKTKIYVPPIVSWDKEHFSGTLYLCESAIKAIAMAQHGYAAIAGNGVRGIYTNSGFSAGWPHELLKGRVVDRVVILFDADWQTNKQVEAAVRNLATGVNQTYAHVAIEHKRLDLYEDKSQGIDDAIGREGVDWLHEWLSSAGVEIEVSPLQRHKDELNETSVVCMHPVSVIRKSTGVLYRVGEFTNLVEADRMFVEEVSTGKSVKIIKVYPAKEWLEWDERNKVDKVVYSPGELLQGAGDDGTFYNTWRDDGVVAAEGDITPFLNVYKNAVPDHETWEYFLNCMAWMMQNRGIRLPKSFFFVGTKPGTGKSMLATTLGRILGRRNFASISSDDLKGAHNSAFVEKELVMLDDVVGVGRALGAKIKRLTTDETVMVNPKNVPQYEITNHAVWMFTSNDLMGVTIEEDDRRIVVLSFEPTVHYPGGVYWEDYVAWLEGSGGGALRWWLEHKDIGSFIPTGMPPNNEIKQKIVAATKTPEEEWLADLRRDPEGMLGNARSCYTATELWYLYSGATQPPTQQEKTAFGKCLTNSGFNQGAGRKTVTIKTPKGRVVGRYWVIKGDGNEWDSKMVIADVKKHMSLATK